MNWVDLILIVPIIWFAYRGFSRGFIIAVASLAGLILGLYAAFYFSGYAEEILREKFDFNSEYLTIIAFILTLVLVIVLVYLLGKILEKLIDMVALGFLNKLAGGLFGVLKALLILSLVIAVLNHFNSDLISKEKKESSLLYKPIESIVPFLWNNLEWLRFEIPGDGELPEDEKNIPV